MLSLTTFFLFWLALFCQNIHSGPVAPTPPPPPVPVKVTTTTPVVAVSSSKAVAPPPSSTPSSVSSTKAATTTTSSVTTSASVSSSKAATPAAVTTTTTTPAAVTSTTTPASVSTSKAATTTTTTSTSTSAVTSKATTTTPAAVTSTTTPASVSTSIVTSAPTTTTTTTSTSTSAVTSKASTTSSAATTTTTAAAAPTLAPLVLLNGIPKSCPTIEKRREIRTLNPTELKQYVDRLVKYRATQSFKDSVTLHHNYTNFIHGQYSNVFLIWHRYYTFDHECRVSKEINERYVQPYWCWGCEKDFGDPANSDVITKLGLGADGDREGTFYEFVSLSSSSTPGTFEKPTKPNNLVKGFCLKDGPFNTSSALYPFKSCILRSFNDNGYGGGKMPAFPSLMNINEVMQQKTLYGFRSNMELFIHPLPHNSLGGHMRSMNSPNDVLFHMHHAFLDRLFSYWQEMQNNYKAVQEQLDPINNIINDISNQQIYPFAVTCGKVMNIKDLCYAYDDYTTTPPASSGMSDISNPSRQFLSQVNDTTLIAKDMSSTNKLTRRGFVSSIDKALKQNETIRDILRACHSLPVNRSRSVVDKYQSPLLVPFNPKIMIVPLLDGLLPEGYVDIGSAPASPPIEDFWITLNNLNKTLVEQTYNKQLDMIYKVNSVPGYIPPGAPWNCDHQMDILYKSNNTLCIVVNGTAIASSADMRDFNDPNGVKMMKSFMLNSIISDNYWKPVSEVASLLISVMGPPFTKDPLSAFNPYAPRFASEVGFSRGDFNDKQTITSKFIQDLVDKKLKANDKLKREEPVLNPRVLEARASYVKLSGGSGSSGSIGF